MIKKLWNSEMSRYKDPNPNSSEFEIDNWRVSQIVLEQVIPKTGYQPFPLNELLLMVGSVARFQSKIIFEWGTHIGKSARVFYEASNALGIKSTIHSIDLPNDIEHGEHPHEQRGILVRGLSSVKLHQGDGVDTALSILRDMDKKARTGEGALFFIDGDHHYESVKRELSAIMETAPRASILLHDSFYQSADSMYNIGVYKAINDCLRDSKEYKRIDTTTGLPGMTLLYRPAINK